MVSSPWPERIEIGAVTEQSSTGYLVTGDIIEITSTELANGGAADRIPVRIMVEKVQGTWLISGYEQSPHSMLRPDPHVSLWLLQGRPAPDSPPGVIRPA